MVKKEQEGFKEYAQQWRELAAQVSIHQGKFTQTNNVAAFAKKTASKKKKGETNTVLIEPTFPRV
ncbi:hypothetical protein CR513_11014, partial [Mucuna pruriens]